MFAKLQSYIAVSRKVVPHTVGMIEFSTIPKDIARDNHHCSSSSSWCFSEIEGEIMKTVFVRVCFFYCTQPHGKIPLFDGTLRQLSIALNIPVDPLS